MKAASIQAGHPLQVAIMTSPFNNSDTETFFRQNSYFGLTPSQVNFFKQGMWPFLDLEGNLFLESPSQIAQGPNGNGAWFQSFVEADIWEKWNREGIEIVNVVPIDNPLADPFDFELFGMHAHMGSDISIKATQRRDAGEHVGVLAQIDGKTVVVEYTELPDEDKAAQDSQGNLKFEIANLSLFSFSMPVVAKLAHQELPLHKAKKRVDSISSENPYAWKFEQYIFDALLFTEHVQTILYPRSTTFAPLKNLQGEDSIASVQAALLAFDRQRYEQVTDFKPPQEARFEIAPSFYYPTAEMLKKWKGKPFPNKEYIDE